MNLFSRALALFGLGGLGNPDKGAQSTGPASRETDAGISVTDERALQISTVWACARIITQTVAGLPLKVYERLDDGRQEVDRNHPLNRLINVSPNRYMTPKQFRAAMTLQRVLWGNGYAVKERIGNRVVALTPLRPEHVEVHRGETGTTYHYATDRGPVVYAQESILHLKGFSPDGIVGLSPLSFARRQMGITVSADTYAAKAFANGGMPIIELRYDKILKADQRKELRDLYKQQHASAFNAGEPIISEAGVTAQSIGIPPDVMQMLESRRFSVSETGRFYGVPNHMLNDTTGSTSWGSGLEQQNIAFLQYVLKPYLEEWEDVLMNSLLAPRDRENIVVEHTVEGLMRGDTKTRAEFYSTMAQNGLMTRNEIRKKENLPSVEGGDDLTVQVNLAPINELNQVGQSNVA